MQSADILQKLMMDIKYYFIIWQIEVKQLKTKEMTESVISMKILGK